jgi:hypothetical protein
MIKFSWKKINDKLHWNANSVLQYFFLRQEILPPCYLPSKVPIKVKDFARLPYERGPCFMLDIDSVLKGADSPNDLYMYLELASKRSIFDLHMRGCKYLNIAMVEECQLEWVDLNPLLTLKDNNIYFKYEQE